MYDRLNKVNDQGKIKIDVGRWKNKSNENGVQSEFNSIKGIQNFNTYVTCPKAAKAL